MGLLAVVYTSKDGIAEIDANLKCEFQLQVPKKCKSAHEAR